jgi:hypothetical protein
MALLNDITVIPRWERPSPTDDVYLEMFYMKGGTLSDVYALSSVYVFKDTDNGNSAVWLGTGSEWPAGRNGLVASSYYRLGPQMVFNNILFNSDSGAMEKSHITNPDDDQFLVTNFKAADPNSWQNTNSASGIFRIGAGHYGVVLRPGVEYQNWDSIPDGSLSANTASSVTSYFDIWTVQDTAESTPRTIIHSFTLEGAGHSNVVTLTEPLMVNTRQSLAQKYINRGSLEKLQIKTDYVVVNRNVGQDVKNIFKDGILENAAIRIIKVSDQTSTGLPFQLIKDWSETKPAIQTDSADTIMYNWETSGLQTGTYQIQASSTVLDGRVMSDQFHVVLR